MGFAASQARLFGLVSRLHDLDEEQKAIKKHLLSFFLCCGKLSLLLLLFKIIILSLLKLEIRLLPKQLNYVSSRISMLMKTTATLLSYLSGIKKQKLAIKEEIESVRRLIGRDISNNFFLQESRLEQHQKKKIKPKEPLIRATVYVLPEECIAEIGALYQGMKQKNKPLWYIQLRLIQETLELLFAIYIQMKLENLLLFIKENLENLWREEDEIEED